VGLELEELRLTQNDEAHGNLQSYTNNYVEQDSEKASALTTFKNEALIIYEKYSSAFSIFY
jgi:hypothetical protein